MSLQDITHLLPLLVLAVTMVIALLSIAFWPRHQVSFWITLTGEFLSLIALFFASRDLPQPVTVLFMMDGFATFYIALILAGGLITTALSYAYIRKFSGNKGEFFLLVLVATFGSAVLVMSNHFISFFLGAGILSLSLFALIGYNPLQRKSIEAAIKYLILVGVASAILLFGMALIYAMVGSMQFNEITFPANQTDADSNLLKIGFGLLIAGISFELALVPFHMWTPDVYQGAPAPVAGFVATVAKAGIFALMLRLFTYVSLPVGSALWIEFVLIAIASMLLGNILAIVQNSIKSLLAYSSIAHLGYLMVGFLASATWSASAMGFYWVAYFVTTLLAFGIVTSVSDPENDVDGIDAYRGLFHRNPWLAVMFVVALLSLTGLPPTGGLIGKVYLAAAGVQGSAWLLLAALILGTILGLFYYMRVVMLLFRQPNETSVSSGRVSPGTMVVLTVLTIALVIMGIFPTPLLDVINRMVSLIG